MDRAHVRSDNPAPKLAHSRGWRIALSIFFVVHFGSIATYILPESEEGVAYIPSAVGEPLVAVTAPFIDLVHPVSEFYLDLTATRQNWDLFAPDPIGWDVSTEVIAYYADEEDDPDGWVADTILLQGPRETPYPHFFDSRENRVRFGLGYESTGEEYREFYARWQCRTLSDARGRKPVGVVLVAIWYPTVIPWEEDQDREPYRQGLGGYDCAELLGDGS